jgi:hypothetical protein
MKRFTLTLGYVALALASACAKDDGRAQTTVVTSGTTGAGVRVTNVQQPQDVEPSERLAGELCMHDAACNRIPSSGTDEARLLATQACVTERTPAAREFLSGWNCSPAASRALFEECLAAIRSERCDAALDRGLDRLDRCRRNAACPETEVRSVR